MGSLSPQQQALIGLAQIAGMKGAAAPNGRAIRFDPYEQASPGMTDSQSGNIEDAIVGNPADRMSRWDRMATATAPAGQPAAATASPPVTPRVDLATAMAVAADKARTGKSTDELYRARGYDTTGTGEGMISNLRTRAAQGDNSAWNKLAWLAPGESPEALLTGTKRERDAKMLRFAQDQATAAANREDEANKAARSDRQAELSQQRSHQTQLAQMQIDAQASARAAQADYNNRKLAIDQMLAQGQLDQARATQEMVKAERERNAKLQEAQALFQDAQLKLENRKVGIAEKQADPMNILKGTAMEASITKAANEGEDPMIVFNRLANPGAAQEAPKTVVPATPEMISEARTAVLGAKSAEDVARALITYAPMLEGRPQIAQQLVSAARINIPDLDAQLKNIAGYGNSTLGGIFNAGEQAGVGTAMATGGIPAVKMGMWLPKMIARGTGMAPSIDVEQARKFKPLWDRLGQLQQ